MAEQNREPRLAATDFSLAEHKRNAYVGDVERGIMPDDVLEPAFWAYHAAKLKPWDRVELRSKDGTWFGESLVLDCSRTWARLFPLRVVMLTSKEVSETQAANANKATGKAKKTADKPINIEDYEIKFRGGLHKWAVVRKSDGDVLSEDHPNKEMAESWLKEHAPQAVTT